MACWIDHPRALRVLRLPLTVLASCQGWLACRCKENVYPTVSVAKLPGKVSTDNPVKRTGQTVFNFWNALCKWKWPLPTSILSTKEFCEIAFSPKGLAQTKVHIYPSQIILTQKFRVWTSELNFWTESVETLSSKESFLKNYRHSTVSAFIKKSDGSPFTEEATP